MDVVGSEIGQKMRSAIKAKLTELGCYVDDELPDYVMVMVANKRTQMQMEDDLQLFLGDNTELFVNWLHQVLKKLQEVTVPLKMDKDKTKERSVSKERKSKEKKDRDKTKKSDVLKKSKKKDKEKLYHKKEKKVQKNKKEKKSKSHERIRPNIPPLLMNMEKDSEPSITDVFAGQILKNHGVNFDVYTPDTKIVETKPIVKDKRPILPVIDPSSILEPERNPAESQSCDTNSSELPKGSQQKEINGTEAKTEEPKQKPVPQADPTSDDDDFLTIRTEPEELLNDLAEDAGAAQAKAERREAPRLRPTERGRVASVVRVRPRPRPAAAAAAAPALLLRAVADAQRSLRALERPAASDRGAPALAPALAASRPAGDSLAVEAIDVHNPTADRDKDTQFIVTMDGYHPNAFLAKKLMTEGLLDDEEASKTLKTLQAPKEAAARKKDETSPGAGGPKKRSRDTSGGGDGDARAVAEEPRKRRASPIVFDVAPRCRAFPSCRFGAACAFAHPRCRFAASCSRRGCRFAHDAGLCKFHPKCANAACPFLHPKPCRFGRACAAGADCGFYHAP